MTPYGTILTSSPAGIVRLVLTDGAMTLQTLTLTHEVTLPTAAVDALLAALGQEAKDAVASQRGEKDWHWSKWSGLTACGTASALASSFPEDITCVTCLDAWLQHCELDPQTARHMAQELRAACAGLPGVPSQEAR